MNMNLVPLETIKDIVKLERFYIRVLPLSHQRCIRFLKILDKIQTLKKHLQCIADQLLLVLTCAGRPTGSYATSSYVLNRSPADCFNGFNWAYTPPYYHGEAWVDFIFYPDSDKSYDLRTNFSRN